MITRIFSGAFAGLTILLAAQVLMLRSVDAAGLITEFNITYVSRSNDAYYEPNRSYAGMELVIPRRPLAGLELAVKESRILGRSLGIKFAFTHLSSLSPDELADSIESAIDEGQHFFILDLPKNELLNIVHRFAGHKALFFNARHHDDSLRNKDCTPGLLHTLPSDAMLNDALAQLLKQKRWTRVLVLHGPESRDEAVARSFEKSASKMGLTVVDTRKFVLSNDPRERSQNNIALLTSGERYDVIFVADEIGEFSRYIPYQSQEPAPVVGAQGLIPAAWHWSWERHGGPQLNQRFARLSDDTMADTEFAAWAASRTVITSVVKTQSQRFEDLRNYIHSEDTVFDLYKGFPGSYRPWNGQLRQPVLLHTANAIIASAPIEGFLHQSNDLDTLGSDQQESICNS